MLRDGVSRVEPPSSWCACCHIYYHVAYAGFPFQHDLIGQGMSVDISRRYPADNRVSVEVGVDRELVEGCVIIREQEMHTCYRDTLYNPP